jgi:hypothetical protein
MEQPPKPRPIHLPLQVIAYFGEWVTNYENMVRNITLQSSKSLPPLKPTSTKQKS